MEHITIKEKLFVVSLFTTLAMYIFELLIPFYVCALITVIMLILMILDEQKNS